MEAPTRERDDISILTVAQSSRLFSPLSRAAYLSVAVGDQRDGHDVLQHGPGGEELLGDEDPAGWTQTLIVQSDGYWRNSLVWSGRVHLHTLLLHLHQETRQQLQNTFKYKIFTRFLVLVKITFFCDNPAQCNVL